MNIKVTVLFAIFISFIIAIIFNTDFCYSQRKGALKGFVKDSVTGESIPYATIQILNTKLGAITNVNGFYLLQNIPIGIYTVQISAVGYNKFARSVSIRLEEPLLLNINLSPSPVEMQPVTKTANRLKEVYETNISAQALTQEEINLVPVAVERDVFRAMKVLPGITSTSDISSQFYVRGGSGDQNLILLDNMMVYNPFHALGLFSIFNADAIKVSEVLTGGFGPEFGGRISSVINIITREGNRNKYSGKLNLGLLSGQGFLEGPSYNGSFILSFRKSYFDKLLHKFLDKDLPLSFYDITGKITYDVSDDGRFYINGFLSKDDINNNRISEPDYSWLNYAFGINYLQTFSDRYIVNVSFSRSFFNGLMDPKGKDNRSKSESKIEDIFFNAKVEAYLENNDIFSGGLTYIVPNIEYSLTNTSGYYISSRDFIAEANLWAKYKLTRIENFTAEAGIRVNIANLSDQADYVLEPRISLKYRILGDLALKTSVGRYHQKMITASNEDDVIPLFETWIPLNLPYHPELCDHYIFGIDGINYSDFINLSLQGYYKKYKNLLGYNQNKTDKLDPDFSLGTGESYGIEAFLKFHSDVTFGWLSYTLSWANKTINNQTFSPRYDKRHNLNIILGTKLPYDIGLNVHWEISSGTPFTPVIAYFDRINLDGLFEGNYRDDDGSSFAILGSKNSKRLPVYHRLDLNFSKSFIIENQTKLNVNLDIVNLYNSENIFYFNRETGAKINMLPFLPTISLGVEF